MKKLLSHAKRFCSGEEGATMVEYGILVALISVVAIAAIVIVGTYVHGAFDEVGDQLTGAGIPLPD
jgi:pilus assembly protein Flp/PilA